LHLYSEWELELISPIGVLQANPASGGSEWTPKYRQPVEHSRGSAALAERLDLERVETMDVPAHQNLL
jgi:hypothetical protein